LPGGTLIILAAISIYITFHQLNIDILDFKVKDSGRLFFV